ncbi:MAG TPA: hypothetical protein VHZ76_07300 [Gammaproteobacteria bacterium]|jgi:hypothetical protein|nr:hypothetical protein [Gammaproteobacteria bacterium]
MKKKLCAAAGQYVNLIGKSLHFFTFMTEISLLITGILFDEDMDKSFAIKIAKQIKKNFIKEQVSRPMALEFLKKYLPYL